MPLPQSKPVDRRERQSAEECVDDLMPRYLKVGRQSLADHKNNQRAKEREQARGAVLPAAAQTVPRAEQQTGQAQAENQEHPEPLDLVGAVIHLPIDIRAPVQRSLEFKLTTTRTFRSPPRCPWAKTP